MAMKQNFPSRKIIHIDMDCFYAAIEMRDNSGLGNKPVAVGGLANERGVISTCNYQARRYGVHSAMATAQALKLCPDLMVLPVNFMKYREVSQSIRKIFFQYTDVVEPLSLDEAFLDVSNSRAFQGSATRIASAIRAEIFNTEKLTASAGVAPNKFLAKVASEWCKPNGQFVVTPDQVEHFVANLPVNKIWGVGKVTAEKMFKRGIRTCRDLQALSLMDLIKSFNSFGVKLFELCRGVDNRQVESHRIRKSLSVEETFLYNLNSIDECMIELEFICEKLKHRLVRISDQKIKKQFVKIKFYDFSYTTIEKLSCSFDLNVFKKLCVSGFGRYCKPVRLLGAGVKFSQKLSSQKKQLNFSDAA